MSQLFVIIPTNLLVILLRKEGMIDRGRYIGIVKWLANVELIGMIRQ
jgi:hypothetical protein